MNSIQFPKMFNSVNTLIVEDHEATALNIKLLLLSEKGTLFGDPYYGTIIKHLIFNSNNQVLIDIVIDAIYTAILQFMPQIIVKRKDIRIVKDGTTLYVNIKAKNVMDFKTDMYSINLMTYEEK